MSIDARSALAPAGESSNVLIDQSILLHYFVEDGENNVRARGSGRGRYVINSVLENAPKAQLRIERPSSEVGVIGSWFGSGEGEPPERRGLLIEEGVERVQIVGNRIGHQWREGIRSGGSEVLISNNVMVDNVMGGGDVDSVLINRGTNVRLVNNRIVSGAERYGAYLTGDLDKYIVTGNDLTGGQLSPDRGGLEVDTTGERRIIRYNFGSNSAESDDEPRLEDEATN